MLVDWTLLVIPIPAVLGLSISRKRKVGVMFIFLTGGLYVFNSIVTFGFPLAYMTLSRGAIASIVSLCYRVQLQNDSTDASWRVRYVLLWT